MVLIQTIGFTGRVKLNQFASTYIAIDWRAILVYFMWATESYKPNLSQIQQQALKGWVSGWSIARLCFSVYLPYILKNNVEFRRK